MAFNELGGHPRGVATRPRHPGSQVAHGDHERLVKVLLVTRPRSLAHQPTGLDAPRDDEPIAGCTGDMSDRYRPLVTPATGTGARPWAGI